MKKIKAFFKKYFPSFLPFAAGAALVLAFAPFNYGILALLCPGVLLYSLEGVKPKQAFIRGGLFGLGFFGFGASWIYVSVYTYGGESLFVSSMVTLLFILTLALFPALFSWTLARLFPVSNLKRSLLAFPAFWVLFEMLRGWIFTGFPWAYLGYTQSSTHLSWLLPVGSVWLASWAVALTSCVLCEIYLYTCDPKVNRKKLTIILASLFLVWGSAFSVKEKEWTFSSGTLTVALLQGNIDQSLRWDNAAIDHITSTYRTMTHENLGADLIVWPESAIPVALPYSQNYLSELGSLVAANKGTLVTGIPVKVDGQESYYNALISLGQGSGLYFKQHLVPFGEYIPFEKWLRGLVTFFDLPMSTFVKGPVQPQMMVQGRPIAPAICYEIAYPFTMRTLTQASQLIITVSNDAWFGTSLGPYQHLQIAQHRALETGRYVLRATNTGFTAVIKPNGKIQNIIPAYEKGTLLDEVTFMEGLTPWLQYGPWSIWIFLGTLSALAFWPNKKRK